MTHPGRAATVFGLAALFATGCRADARAAAVNRETAAGDTVPAAGVSGGPAAYVVFRDTILPSDLEWLTHQGFVVERVDTAAHGAAGRVTPAFRVNPKSNPRVLRFTTAMR